MREIGIDELKLIQLDILSAVHVFCINNSIKYSLTGGTLLGAIRHQGYIPWDDDIDICMPRPDYERFLRLFNGASEDYYVISPELDWNFYAPYANVCHKRTVVDEGANGHRGIDMGIKIDVFPVDGLPSDESDYINKQNRIDEINSILFAKRYILHKLILKNFREALSCVKKRLFNCFKSYRDYQRELHSIVTGVEFGHSPYANAWVFSVVKERLDLDIFESFIDVPFEGRSFKAVKAYDKYLTKLYGDYMKLPPESKRLAKHGFTAYWLD